MQKEQVVAWNGRHLIPTISSYLLRKKDIPGMVSIVKAIRMVSPRFSAILLLCYHYFFKQQQQKSDCVLLELQVHIPASIGGLLNSSLGRIGFQKKTIPSMRDTVIVYVTGGIASHEIQEFQRILENESQSPIRLFLLSERIDVIDQKICNLFDILRPLSS